jgi:hypothetical protein
MFRLMFCSHYQADSNNLLFFRWVRKIAKSDYYLRHIRPSVCLSACVCLSLRQFAWNSAPTRRILMKHDTLHEDGSKFMTVSRCIVLMRNTLNNCCREKQNSILCSIYFFSRVAPFMRYCRKMWCGQRP